MAQLRDELGYLEAGQLAALAGLGTLCDLDLDLLAGTQIFGMNAEAARGDLLDVGIRVVAILIRREARAVLAPFAGNGLGADPVHGNGQCFVRFR